MLKIAERNDDKLLWFVRDSEQLVRTDTFPSEKEKTTLRVTNSPFDMGYTVRDFSKVGSVAAFQNVFFWQHFTNGKRGPFKYVEVVMSQITGIGGTSGSGYVCTRIISDF